jgi:hypothetical protein
MVRIVIPEQKVDTTRAYVVVLAGPIQEFFGWRHGVIQEFVKEYKPDRPLYVICPDRTVDDDLDFRRYVVNKPENSFESHDEWMRHYLEICRDGSQGAILFWIPEDENKRFHSHVDGVSSFLKLVDIMGREELLSTNLILGGKHGFPNVGTASQCIVDRAIQSNGIHRDLESMRDKVIEMEENVRQDLR